MFKLLDKKIFTIVRSNCLSGLIVVCLFFQKVLSRTFNIKKSNNLDQISTDLLLVLIGVQTACKHYQQLAKTAASKVKDRDCPFYSGMFNLAQLNYHLVAFN